MNRILSVTALAGAAVLSLAAPAAAAPPEAAMKNHVQYWEGQTGGECIKVEFRNGVKSFTLPELVDGREYTLLVLKAGSGDLAHDVKFLPGNGPYTHQTGKDLSHAIFCVGDGDTYGGGEDPYATL